MDDLQKQKIELEIQEKELQAKEFLSAFPIAKRYTIITMAILIIPMFFAAKYAVAALYFSNYNRTSSPAHPSNLTTLPVKILSAANLSIAGNAYSSYALIKNQNKDLSVVDLKYTFHLFNSQNQEIYTYSGDTFLLPGEQKYLILPNARINQVPTSVEVEIPDPVWQKRVNLPNVIISTGVPSYGDQQNPQGFYIKGTLQNQSAFPLKSVTVQGIIFDKNHNVIAATEYTANTVASKEQRAYQMFWPVPLSQFMAGLPQINVEGVPET